MLLPLGEPRTALIGAVGVSIVAASKAFRQPRLHSSKLRFRFSD